MYNQAILQLHRRALSCSAQASTFPNHSLRVMNGGVVDGEVSSGLMYSGSKKERGGRILYVHGLHSVALRLDLLKDGLQPVLERAWSSIRVFGGYP